MSDRIVLGPPKMSFASSSLGGMKRSDDNLSGFKKPLETPREGRNPRGPPSTLEQGFGRETIEKLSSHKLLPKVTPKDITGSRQGSTASSGSRIGSSTRTSGQPMSTSNNSLSSNGIGSGSGIGLGSRSQRSDTPEWMSYNAELDEFAKEGGGDGEQQVFMDDIQIWKARMKEHERREKEKEARLDPKGLSRADSSSSWRSSASSALTTENTADSKLASDAKNQMSAEKPLSRTLLSTQPIQDIDLFFSPGGMDLNQPFDSPSAFDKFLSQHTVAASSMNDSTQPKPPRKTDGSRFARFFTEDESESSNDNEEFKGAPTDMPGQQVSLDQLFQSHAPNPSAAAPPPLGRMPSEAEILESMMAAQSLTSPSATSTSFQDPSIVTFQAKPTLLDTLTKPPSDKAISPEATRPTSSSALSETSQTHGSGAPTAATSPSTPSSETSRPASRPVQVAFGGGIPTSVYRQLSGKTDSQKSASPLIRPLNSVNGSSTNGGGASPSLSSPSVSSPRQFNAQTALPAHQQQQSSQGQTSAMQQQHQQQQQQQQQPSTQQPQMNRTFGPYNQGPGPNLHSPVMDPRMSGMYPNGGPSPMGGPGHGPENEATTFFNGIPMQRPGQGVPSQFGQQMPPFNHMNGPGDFMAPHPSQFVGMSPYGAPMHPGMFPMNPVEMLMHRGPGGPPPPRPMPGMGPGPGPNHFVPNQFGHPMSGMPHSGIPLNAPPFFRPQVSKPMMTREEFERRNRQQ
ncbi:hypothetical protein BG011_000362 [Mortierella polycephala]|uniref:Uncharacterized protein n=1 Tax=Mortierella polycephala TaxID=41804 RepID=A0A9P6Q924_9FUNG|nr:hypothetical protein BG011_000362 [Mortierella polycephala]